MPEPLEEDTGMSADSSSQPGRQSSSDSDSSTSTEDEEIETETQQRMKAEIAKLNAQEHLKTSRMLDLAKKSFHSHAGIIYVSDDIWTELWNSSGPCHFYVGLQSLEKAPSQRDRSIGFLADLGPPNTQHTSTSPLLRMKIVNEVLHTDMAVVCGLQDAIRSFNHDHVMPFRSIIPFEKELRRRHLETEERFSDMAVKTPKHRDVVRQELDWVPKNVSYVRHPVVSLDPLEHSNDIGKARVLRDGYRALVHLLDNELSSLVQDQRRIEAGSVEKLPFLHLWHLFKPGQTIITNDPELQAYRVLQVTGGRKQMRDGKDKATHKAKISDLTIDCFHLDFDGQEFGPIPAVIKIKPYEGSRAIRQLPAYPLSLAAEPDLAQVLTKRGKKFEEMVEASHRKYSGLSLRGKQPFDNLEEIDGDVMVDFKLAYLTNEPLRKIDVPAFRGGVIDEPTEEDSAETRDSCHAVSLYFDDAKAIRHRWAQWSTQTDLLEKRSPGALTAECYNLLPARVWGYVFLRRKWYPLNIDLVQPLQKNKAGTADGFDKLVLPPGHKDIVRALVRTHAKKPESTDGKAPIKLQREFDIVKGKGKGLIILLHGAPGVGKTSTAECVAANSGKPLFPITIGDVGGDSAQQVEQNLEKYFDLARKWNCVLLLDEADVFLGTRVAGNITQNSLVSVFLRALEYYSGILILTTNRVGSFDEAIKSRVHCALYYPPLDKNQTMEVWKMNLDSLEERNANTEQSQRIQFERKEIEEYARNHWRKGKRSSKWNGRQIKNAFQTAVALADWDNHDLTQGRGSPDGTVLKAWHFDKVALASAHFDMYLERTRTSDQQRARDEAFREDNVGLRLPEPSEPDEETESEEETKKKRRSSKKSSAKKSKSLKEKKRSKSKKQVELESDEKSTEESSSEEETS